jgi:hypothetical protein
VTIKFGRIAIALALAICGAAEAQVLRSPPRGCLSPESISGIRAVARSDECFIPWVNALVAPDLDDRNAARAGLSIIGGRPAVDVLRSDYERSKERGSLRALIAAMATTGSPEDILFLVSHLKGPFIGNSDIWGATQAAAMTLGFLRASPARDSLRALLARYGPESFAGHAVAWAVEAIDRPACADSTSPEIGRGLLRIVMSCNPPLLSKSVVYQDASSGGTWRFIGGAWRHSGWTAGDTTRYRSVMSSAIQISPDSTHAFVQISMNCGSLCGEGWTFRLLRVGKAWRVVNGRFDWVS